MPISRCARIISGESDGRLMAPSSSIDRSMRLLPRNYRFRNSHCRRSLLRFQARPMFYLLGRVDLTSGFVTENSTRSSFHQEGSSAAAIKTSTLSPAEGPFLARARLLGRMIHAVLDPAITDDRYFFRSVARPLEWHLSSPKLVRTLFFRCCCDPASLMDLVLFMPFRTPHRSIG